jgi:hypothetical protein
MYNDSFMRRVILSNKMTKFKKNEIESNPISVAKPSSDDKNESPRFNDLQINFLSVKST